MDILSTIKQHSGDLDRVKRLIGLLGMANDARTLSVWPTSSKAGNFGC
jgi:hypothetical protein